MRFSKRRCAYLKKRIGVLRSQGYSYKQIAKKLGISLSSVYRLRQPIDNSVPVVYPLGNARASAVSRSVAMRLRTSLSARLVAFALRVSPSTIYRWQQKSNGECRVSRVQTV